MKWRRLLNQVKGTRSENDGRVSFVRLQHLKCFGVLFGIDLAEEES